MKTKTGLFLKIGLLGMIAGIGLLAFGVTKVGAISYGGAATIPNVVTSTGYVMATITQGQNDGIFLNGNYYQGQLSIAANAFGKYNSSVGTGRTLIKAYTFLCYSGPSTCGEVDYFFSGASLWREMHTYNNQSYSGTFTEIYSFSGKSSGDPFPTDFIVGITTQFVKNTSVGVTGTYLFSDVVHIYNENGEHIRIINEFSGVDSFWSSDIKNYFGWKLSNQSNTNFWQASLIYDSWGSGYRATFTGGTDLSWTGSTGDYVSEFLNSSTGTLLQETLMHYYGSTGTSTGGTAAGVDYFATCGSFLDVGCYIQGFWNGISDTISGWFDNIFPSVSWSAAYTTGCSSSGSTATGSNLTGSGLSYIEKLQTFLLVVIPLSPPEGTEYCLIGGFTGTIQYQGMILEESRDQMPGFGTMFDVMFLTLMGYILIATIIRHGGGMINTSGDHWHLPEEILVQRESFKYDVRPQKKSPIKTRVESAFNKKESFKYKTK